MGVMKPIVALVCFVSLLGAAAESLNVFGQKWTITTPAADWSVGENLLQLKTSSEPIPGQPRRPTHFALLDSKPYSKVTVEGEQLDRVWRGLSDEEKATAIQAVLQAQVDAILAIQ